MVYVFDEIPSFEECQAFCRSDPEENRNIIVVKDGIVEYCFKGNEDEVNNALLATYSLHEQAYPLLIHRTVPPGCFFEGYLRNQKTDISADRYPYAQADQRCFAGTAVSTTCGNERIELC